MNTLFSLKLSPLTPLISAYNSVIHVKSKDKINMVLEPLQAMIQLSFLSILPIGTKIAIDDNLMYLQLPSLIQPIARWYNIYKKDDVYFLFQVIKRFIKWYNPFTNKTSPISKELYKLILKMSNDGLSNLLKTYDTSGSNALIQIVTMYRTMLSHDGFDKVLSDKITPIGQELDIDNSSKIDDVFQHITSLYDQSTISIIYNTLLLIQKEDSIDNQNNMILGLSLITGKTNKLIQSWIKNNLMI